MLSKIVGLSARSIQIWFQNRRQKLKLEENKKVQEALCQKKEFAMRVLHSAYEQNPRPSGKELEELAAKVDITTASLKIWFETKYSKQRVEEQLAYRPSAPENSSSGQPKGFRDGNQPIRAISANPYLNINTNLTSMYAQAAPDFSSFLNVDSDSEFHMNKFLVDDLFTPSSICTPPMFSPSGFPYSEERLNSSTAPMYPMHYPPMANMDTSGFAFETQRDVKVDKEVSCNVYDQWNLFAQVFRSQSPLKSNLSAQDLCVLDQSLSMVTSSPDSSSQDLFQNMEDFKL
jgi:hypothetical protein